MLASAVRRAVRPPMAQYVNWFSRGFLNRTSWLRQDVDFLTRSAQSDQARYIILDAASNPLVTAEGTGDIHDIVKTKLEGQLNVVTLTWNDVSSYYPSSEPIFVKEATASLATRPLIVFLGIDERGLPSPASGTAGASSTSSSSNDQASRVQKSLPKAADTGYTPDGKPYFVIDTSHHPKLAEKAMEIAGGDQKALFMDLRAELLCLDFDSTGVVAEARALVDWNKRNRFCAGCGRPTGSAWAGWKRGCLPDTEEQIANGGERPPCVSKKGVHNFAYPRTDPVVIMAVQSHDKKKMLLGRQKVWPKDFFSCLAGFVEPGESIEESVKREVWEEAGIRVDHVQYHSSQPWPFPGSLMIGCLATAVPDAEIRTDLDNELETADFYSYETVKTAVKKAGQTGLSRVEVAQIQKASDTAEESAEKPKEEATLATNVRLPPKSAIAHTLIKAWVDQVEMEGAVHL